MCAGVPCQAGAVTPALKLPTDLAAGNFAKRPNLMPIFTLNVCDAAPPVQAAKLAEEIIKNNPEAYH